MIYKVTYRSIVIKHAKIHYDNAGKRLTIKSKDDDGWYSDKLHFEYATFEHLDDNLIIFFVSHGIGKTLDRVFCEFKEIE